MERTSYNMANIIKHYTIEKEEGFHKIFLKTGIKGFAFLYGKGDESAEFNRDQCVFRLQHEEEENIKQMFGTSVLFKELNTSVDFLSVGIGNVDRIPIIEDGDVQQRPVLAYKSKDLKCRVEERNNSTVVVKSMLMAPVFESDIKLHYKELRFETTIKVDSAKGTADIVTEQVNKTGSEPDFDFMEITLASPKEEKIYGLGL